MPRGQCARRTTTSPKLTLAKQTNVNSLYVGCWYANTHVPPDIHNNG